MYNIYKLTSKSENKSYIGQTSRNILTRFIEHKSTATKKPFSELHHAINRNGMIDFTLETLEECEKDVADQREQYWISFYETTNIEKGYNKAKGGRGNPGLPVSAETREKIRLRNKGFSKEAREAKSIAATGTPVSDSVAKLNRERGMKVAKAILQYSVSGELLNEFPSIIEASRATNTDRRTIQRQLSGEYAMNGSGRSTSNLKFIWKRK